MLQVAFVPGSMERGVHRLSPGALHAELCLRVFSNRTPTSDCDLPQRFRSSKVVNL